MISVSTGRNIMLAPREDLGVKGIACCRIWRGFFFLFFNIPCTDVIIIFWLLTSSHTLCWFIVNLFFCPALFLHCTQLYHIKINLLNNWFQDLTLSLHLYSASLSSHMILLTLHLLILPPSDPFYFLLYVLVRFISRMVKKPFPITNHCLL